MCPHFVRLSEGARPVDCDRWGSIPNIGDTGIFKWRTKKAEMKLAEALFLIQKDEEAWIQISLSSLLLSP